MRETNQGIRRFVIWGLSRLTLRVARELVASGSQVVVVAPEDNHDLVGLLTPGETSNLLLIVESDLHRAFEMAGLSESDCFLALSDDDLQNISAALTSRRVAPDVPLVLRTFEPELADRLGQILNSRRAFSASGLAAPSLVAAALSAEMIHTLRLGATDVVICQISFSTEKQVEKIQDLVRNSHCALLSVTPREDNANDAPGKNYSEGIPLAIVGGVMGDVLKLTLSQSSTFHLGRNRRLRDSARKPKRIRPSTYSTLLPKIAASLGLFLILSTGVFAAADDLTPVGALLTAMSTALGNPVSGHSTWLKVVDVLTMIAGGALIAVLFSQLASVATAQRLESQMGRQASRLRNHVVVAGLGTVGYRVARLLDALGIPFAVMDRSPDPRFVEAIARLGPVLYGDSRLPENLERLSIDQAACLIACSDEDLVNISTCLEVRRSRPDLRAVARVFDDAIALGMTESLGVTAISTSSVAAAAFAGAAADHFAQRHFEIGSKRYSALRYDADRDAGQVELAGWGDMGIRILAVETSDGSVLRPGDSIARLEAGDAAIIAGPQEAISQIIARIRT